MLCDGEPRTFTTGSGRLELAEAIAAEENPLTARVSVNRVWAEMIGQGFYEPIDDLGPDRECSAPKAMNFLSSQFVASGHDVKWVLNARQQDSNLASEDTFAVGIGLTVNV